MRGVFRVFGTALINAVIMAIFAGLHARTVLWVTSQSSIPWVLQEVGLALVTVLMLIIAQPFKRAKTMLSAVLGTVGGTSSVSGMLGRRGSDKAATPSEEYWQKQRERNYDNSNPIGPQYFREQTVPEEHSNSIGYLTAAAAAQQAGSSGLSNAAGWAANAMPPARIALASAQAGHELTGNLANYVRPEPAAETPGVIEAAPQALTPGIAAPQPEEWYRPAENDAVPRAASAVRDRDGAAFVITEAAPIEEPYAPDDPAVSQPPELTRSR
jgi:hypothetical protein